MPPYAQDLHAEGLLLAITAEIASRLVKKRGVHSSKQSKSQCYWLNYSSSAENTKPAL
jgi:hypothetical protein